MSHMRIGEGSYCLSKVETEQLCVHMYSKKHTCIQVCMGVLEMNVIEFDCDGECELLCVMQYTILNLGLPIL